MYWKEFKLLLENVLAVEKNVEGKPKETKQREGNDETGKQVQKRMQNSKNR